jgi:hypothetical protein
MWPLRIIKVHIREGFFTFDQARQRADTLAQGGDAQPGHFARANVCKVRLAHVSETQQCRF